MSRGEPLKLAAHVQVVVTITLDAHSSWGADTTAQQIHDQAVNETLNAVGQELNRLGWRHSFDNAQAKVTTFMRTAK